MISGETQVSLTVIFALVACIGVVINLFRNNKKDNQEEDKDRNLMTKDLLKANLKLDQICDTLVNMGLDVKDTNKSLQAIKDLQVHHDEQIKALWRNVDDLKKEIKEIRGDGNNE